MTAAAAGRTKAVYVTDAHAGEPTQIAIEVPDNLFAQASLGWAALASATSYPLRYKRLRPRHAEGAYVDSGGAVHRVKAICATTSCDLWTGAATTWDYVDNGGNTNVAAVTGYVGEKVTVVTAGS